MHWRLALMCSSNASEHFERVAFVDAVVEQGSADRLVTKVMHLELEPAHFLKAFAGRVTQAVRCPPVVTSPGVVGFERHWIRLASQPFDCAL